jgi:colicin import membrane protein
MRPAEFTTEAIVQAGQDMQATGRNITGFALRQKIGGGNPTRLKQIWDEHINKQTTTKTEPISELPIEITEGITTIAKTLTEHLTTLAIELNDKAVKAAERRVQNIRHTADEQREQANQELADASQTVDEFEAKLDEAATNSETLKKQLEDSQTANQAQTIELAKVHERLIFIERTNKATTEQHKLELAHLNSNIENTRKRHQQETEQLRTELTKAQAKIEATEQAHQEQRKATTAEIQRTTDSAKQALTERDNAHKETNSAREEIAKLHGQVETLKIQVTEQLRALTIHKMPNNKETKTAAKID